MKAVRFHEHGGPEVLRYEDVPDPTPRPTEVLLRVKAVALNHLDVWLRKGLPGMKIPLPKIGGCDIAGEVVCRGRHCAPASRSASASWSPPASPAVNAPPVSAATTTCAAGSRWSAAT